MMKPTLSDVRNLFEDWRSQQANTRQPIPDKLWSKAKTLVPTYRQSQICKALRISGSQFKNNCSNSGNCVTSSLSSDLFVQTIPPVARNAASTMCEIVLTTSSKTMQIHLSVEHLPALVPALKELL